MVYRRLPIPDLSFHLSIDPLAAFDRLHARPKLDHIPNLASSRRLAAYSDAFEATTALCGYEPHVVRTDRPLAETVAEVVAEVQRWDRLNDARLLGSNSAE
jgi:hypothetical protein